MSLKRWVSVLLLGLLLVGAACSRPGRQSPTPTPLPTASLPAGGTFDQTLQSGGRTRVYRLHLPPGYDPARPAALVIALHGYAAGPKSQERLSGLSDLADKEGFVVVYPEGLPDRQGRKGWLSGPQAADDVTFVRDLIDHLVAELSLDPARVYVTGMSNGGGMAHKLGCELPRRVAAVAPVAGAYLYPDCQPERPVPVVAFHGTTDPVVPYAGYDRLPGVEDWAAGWAGRNGCASTLSVVYQQGEVTGQAWADCEADVVLYTIKGGGHTWPGGGGMDARFGRTTADVDASQVMWAFFQAHPMEP